MSDKFHPYKAQPDTAFWARSVAKDFQGGAVARSYGGDFMRPGDRVASMGSCFASNLVPYIERAGLEYVRQEEVHPQFRHLPENFGYRNFSAAYGNIYTVRQMLQLVQRCTGEFVPLVDRWYDTGNVIDPFRPGLRFPARNDVEFDVLQGQHLAAVRRVFEHATVMVLTLGLTEAWVDVRDGAVYPSCPGTIAGDFDGSVHRFHNFTVSEIVQDLSALVSKVHEINPGVRFILTVSPVPLVATAGNRHVLAATIYSKSVLRVAAEEATGLCPKVQYFPAYEIVTGPQAPESYFESDRRSVTPEAVEKVMAALLGTALEATPTPAATTQTPTETQSPAAKLAEAASRMVEAECEEAAQGL